VRHQKQRTQLVKVVRPFSHRGKEYFVGEEAELLPRHAEAMVRYGFCVLTKDRLVPKDRIQRPKSRTVEPTFRNRPAMEIK
jgi:hypothetical protein